jgi:hypothetical protein
MKPALVSVKPESIKQDTLKKDALPMGPPMPFIEKPPKTKSVKVSTPIGDIESDSGNHGVDIITIVGIIVFLYVGKKLVDKYIKK